MIYSIRLFVRKKFNLNIEELNQNNIIFNKVI